MPNPKRGWLENAPVRWYNCRIPQEKAPVRVPVRSAGEVAGKGRLEIYACELLLALSCSLHCSSRRA